MAGSPLIGKTISHYRILEKLGYMTTPVTVIDGEAIVGFDRARLEKLLLN